MDGHDKIFSGALRRTCAFHFQIRSGVTGVTVSEKSWHNTSDEKISWVHAADC